MSDLALQFYAAAGRICETPNRRGSHIGIARASMSESSAISRAAMAGAFFAKGDGAGTLGDSAGDTGTERRDGWVGRVCSG